MFHNCKISLSRALSGNLREDLLSTIDEDTACRDKRPTETEDTSERLPAGRCSKEREDSRATKKIVFGGFLEGRRAKR